MSIANALAGAAGGFMQGKIMKKRQEREEVMDKITKDYMQARTNSLNKGTTKESSTETDEEVDPLTGLPKIKMANGGVVGDMPQHYDRYSWQRQNFKKGQPEMDGPSFVVVTVK
jgi:hypothetical protein